ncbi:MAG: hypothetical protein QXT68_04560 [Halobacteria archaeon]
MGEVNGGLRALLIQSRAGLPTIAAQMASQGMISEEALSRLQETHRGGANGTNGRKAVNVSGEPVRVI